jgi:hypothetical protein
VDLDGAAFMSKRVWAWAAIHFLLLSTAASASDLKNMIGRWRWQQFTMEVTECQSDTLCAKIIDGSKNVGMEVFASKILAKDGDLFGQIFHPETKDMYNTRFRQKDPDTWRLDGCTAARVCLSGEFVRVK